MVTFPAMVKKATYAFLLRPIEYVSPVLCERAREEGDVATVCGARDCSSLVCAGEWS